MARTEKFTIEISCPRGTAKSADFWAVVADLETAARGAALGLSGGFGASDYWTVTGSRRAVTNAVCYLVDRGYCEHADAADALDEVNETAANEIRAEGERLQAEHDAEQAAERRSVLEQGGCFTEPLTSLPSVGAIVTIAGHAQPLYPGGCCHRGEHGEHEPLRQGLIEVVGLDPAQGKAFCRFVDRSNDGYWIEPGRLTFVIDPLTGKPISRDACLQHAEQPQLRLDAEPVRPGDATSNAIGDLLGA